MQHLDIVDISARYGREPVLQRISLGVDRGEIISLIGPSGSGKSTLLRVLMGLLRPTEGYISFSGERIDYTSARNVREIRNRFAIVFQAYNLFQNMTALDNVTVAPLKIRRRDKREVVPEAEALLEKVGLKDKMRAYPDELSGGQQQRVAIARALALRPELLLLDEVTASLDPELVAEVLDTIRELAGEGMTMLIVSHEMGFVREVSSTVAFMDAGRVVEVGPPDQVFGDPQEARTQDFVRKILRG
ncbi:amino acid ABC transporter ATP-binding protein [Acuticoccus sp.]|uniref:amino acid ABC transporter ATP-binding protein n=1 Tax=Acuticoccus sp. TaxID=1904378 RepID=UPI003B526418